MVKQTWVIPSNGRKRVFHWDLALRVGEILGETFPAELQGLEVKRTRQHGVIMVVVAL